MKKFVNILMKVLQIGEVAVPVVVNLAAPGWGTFAGVMIQSILNAEAVHGPGNGEAKFNTALTMVQGAIPTLMTTMEASTGKTLVNEDMFAQGIQELINAGVKIFNSFGALPKKV